MVIDSYQCIAESLIEVHSNTRITRELREKLVKAIGKVGIFNKPEIIKAAKNALEKEKISMIN